MNIVFSAKHRPNTCDEEGGLSVNAFFPKNIILIGIFFQLGLVPVYII